MVVSKSVNCKLPLVSARLVNIGNQVERLVEASIRQVVFEMVLSVN